MMTSFFFAAMSTLGFGILFNIPRKQLLPASLTGAIGWLVYSGLVESFDSVVMAAFFGAWVVGMISEWLARKRKMPATVFVIPGLIPLVPGYGLYYSMLKVVEADYASATEMGAETILVALAISSAVIVASSIGRKFKRKGTR
jgi:uncharacterized membrane protein YjjB (DUF3815 family)